MSTRAHAVLSHRVAEVDARCRLLLAQPEFAAVPAIAAKLDLGLADLRDIAVRASRGRLPKEQWTALAGACAATGLPKNEHILERFVLLNAGLPNLPAVAYLPVPESVRLSLLDQFLYVCAPERETDRLLNPNDYGFRSMCRFMLLERIPLGVMDVEVSGVPRSSFLKMPARDIARALACVYVRAGGHKPMFESHTAFRQILPIFTVESSASAFPLLAETMKLQPSIRGYFGSSWMLDPKLGEVSPHLAWLMDWYRECCEFGAIWTTVGEASIDSGFMVGDRHRRKAYLDGKWKPKQGLLIWAREDLLHWYRSRYHA